MQNGILDEDEDVDNSYEVKKLSYNDALDNIRLFTTDIWKCEKLPKSDGFTSVLCNICLKNELLDERFSTLTAADILADVSLETKDDCEIKNDETGNPDEEDYFRSDVFKLRQEFQGVPLNIEKDHNTNQTESCLEGEEKVVGHGRNEEKQPMTYNHAFDPRQTFAGLQDEAFPNCRFQRADDIPQDNVCLAVDDVSDIVYEYLNKYHDYLTSLRSKPGKWVNQPDAILPAKFASFDLWSADRNQVSVDRETDPECRLLAAKVTSSSVKRLWSDGSCYTSSSEERDVYSNQGSESEESISPRTSPNNLCPREDEDDRFPEFPDAFSYPFFQSDSERTCPDEPISPLWSGRNVDSFQDFVPRMSYGFNLPVPNVPQEFELPVPGENVQQKQQGVKDGMPASKFFNLWRVPESNVGHGDGISSRCSEKSESRSSSEKSSPEAGLQIPRLVSTKRRERPIRGAKNTRRSGQKDYKVTFVDCDDQPENSRYPSQSRTWNSRAAISDTTVWSYSDIVGDKKRGTSRSETHQEVRTQGSRRHSPRVEKVELSAKSEPFFPRGSESVYQEGSSPVRGLNTIDEELSAREAVKTSFKESLEKRTSLSPVCEPFVPRSSQRKYVCQNTQEDEEQEEDEKNIDYLCGQMNFDDFSKDDVSVGQYETWSPATDVVDKDYKLFGERKLIPDDIFSLIDTEGLKPKDVWGMKKGPIDLAETSLADWYKTSKMETCYKPSDWDVIKNTSKVETKTYWSSFEPKETAKSVVQRPLTQNPSSSLPSSKGQLPPQSVWSRSDLSHHSQDPAKCSSKTSQNSLSLTRPSFQHGIDNQEARMFRLQTISGHDLLSSCSQVEPCSRPSQQNVTSSWSGADKLGLTTSGQDGGAKLMQGVNPVRTNSSMTFVSNPMARLPNQQPYENSCRKMVVLHPHPSQPEARPSLTTTVFPHAYTTPQHATLRPAYQPLQQSFGQALRRVPLEHRLHPPVISRQNPTFAQTPAGFQHTLPSQTYRHVTVAPNYNAPKLVAVPTFDAHTPRFFTPFLNFNNHNEAYRSKSEMANSSFDLIGCRDEEQEKNEKRVRARPIRANPANLIHIT